jgi:metal-responsive CopG/Arc/MetJ family transcriptional regulator
MAFLKKRRVSIMLEGDLITEIDKIVFKRREKEEPSLKTTSRSEVVEELVRKGLKRHG